MSVNHIEPRIESSVMLRLARKYNWASKPFRQTLFWCFHPQQFVLKLTLRPFSLQWGTETYAVVASLQAATYASP